MDITSIVSSIIGFHSLSLTRYLMLGKASPAEIPPEPSDLVCVVVFCSSHDAEVDVICRSVQNATEASRDAVVTPSKDRAVMERADSLTIPVTDAAAAVTPQSAAPSSATSAFQPGWQVLFAFGTSLYAFEAVHVNALRREDNIRRTRQIEASVRISARLEQEVFTLSLVGSKHTSCSDDLCFIQFQSCHSKIESLVTWGDVFLYAFCHACQKIHTIFDECSLAVLQIGTECVVWAIVSR